MKTKILTLLVLFAIAIVGCQKDEADKPVVKQDVSFGIEHVDPLGLKSDIYDIMCPEDLTPVKAKIVIEYFDEDNVLQTETFYPLVFFLNQRWYTQAIKLAPGTYTIKEFYLLDADDDIIMATPAFGSVYAPYVEGNTVVKEFVVDPFVKKEIKMWVLCYEEAKYEEFGFFWFRINRIVVREKCFFGDLCVKNPLEYEGSWYENQITGLLIDMPAIFKIHAYKTTPEGQVQLPNSPFTNATAEAGWGVGAPVCVQWADNIDIQGEEFTFELWIYVAVGSGFDFVLFHTWTFVDDQMVGYNGEQVIDFVLGNCGYGGTPPFLLLAPYMNIPDWMQIDITHNANATPWYWDVNIDFVSPLGSYDLPSSGFLAGWCGDGTVTITPGNNKKFWLYSSLYPASWPTGIPAYITPAKLNSVNWLFNNLADYGIIISGNLIDPTDGLTIAQGHSMQNAIWRIINHNMGGVPYFATEGPSSTDMAEAAQLNTTFTPLPGGWAAILMVPDVNGVPDATKAQLLFAVVDP